MGAAGSEVAIHSATIALMKMTFDDCRARAASRVRPARCQPEFLFGMLFVIGVLVLAAMKYINPIVAALMHVAGSLLVVFKQPRLVRHGRNSNLITPPIQPDRAITGTRRGRRQLHPGAETCRCPDLRPTIVVRKDAIRPCRPAPNAMPTPQSPARTGETIVAVRGLTKVSRTSGAGPRPGAVDGVDFEVRRGESSACSRPERSGKSTTVKMLLGLALPNPRSHRSLGKSPRPRPHQSRIGTARGVHSTAISTRTKTVDFFGNLFHLSNDERRQRTEQLLTWSDDPARSRSGR